MEKTAILRAGELAPATRAWLASVLHVDLQDSDDLELTVRRAIQSRVAGRGGASVRGRRDAVARVGQEDGCPASKW